VSQHWMRRWVLRIQRLSVRAEGVAATLATPKQPCSNAQFLLKLPA
jgi:hypothetical protein